MKMFKKALAAVLLGAMALTMMTGCWGWGAPAAKPTNVKANKVLSTLNKENTYKEPADQALTALQEVTTAENLTTADIQNELKKMNTFSFAGGSQYDLYMWTNHSTNREDDTVLYPYLYKVQEKHVNNEATLTALLSENFVKKGQFDATEEQLAILGKLLKDVDTVGVTVGQVHGVDVLLVVVKAGTEIPQTLPADSE